MVFIIDRVVTTVALMNLCLFVSGCSSGPETPPATSANIPIPSSTSLSPTVSAPAPPIIPTPETSVSVSRFDIARLMGKRMSEVKRIMRPYKSLGQGELSNDPEDDWPGDTALNYEWYNSDTSIDIVCDKSTHRVVFCNVANNGSGGLNANLDDWQTILPRFGMEPDEQPDDLHPAYTVWHNYHGRYYVHIYGHSPDRQAWSIEMAKTGEHYSGEQD